MKFLSLQKHPEIAASKITNTATVKARGCGPITAEATVLADKSADLIVTQTTNAPTVYVGEDLTYTILVTNIGPSTATGVVLTDILPIETTFKSLIVSAEIYNRTGSIITWNLGELSKGSTSTITITVTANAPGTIKNFTRVAGNEFDPNIENNTFLETTTVKPLEPRYRGFDFF